MYHFSINICHSRSLCVCSGIRVTRIGVYCPRTFGLSFLRNRFGSCVKSLLSFRGIVSILLSVIYFYCTNEVLQDKMSVQYFLCLDFEATCWPNNYGKSIAEIIGEWALNGIDSIAKCVCSSRVFLFSQNSLQFS